MIRVTEEDLAEERPGERLLKYLQQPDFGHIAQPGVIL